MSSYPVVLRLEGRPVVVVGGGRVAARKVACLVEAGADVTVVAPEVDESIESRVGVRCLRRAFRCVDLEGAWLAFAATDSREVNDAVAQACAARRILCNVADDPVRCDFTLPAVARRGELVLTASTSGASPSVARRLVARLAEELPTGWIEGIAIMGRLRAHLGARGSAEARRRLWRALADDLPEGPAEDPAGWLVRGSEAAGDLLDEAEIDSALTGPPG